jgi:integrase/recombinase XerD
MNASANPTHQTPLTADHSGPRTASSDATPVLPAAALGDGLAHVDLVWKQAALAYAVELGRRSGSVRTPQERMRYVARFLTAVPDPSRARPGEIHAFAYGIGPSGRPPSASTVTARLGAIRGFFAFAIRMGLLRDNPALAVKLPRPDAPIPRGLSAPQLRRLLEAVPATPSGARDRAIILTATLTGLRRSEVLGLQAGDLRADAAAGVVTFRVRAKGGKQRHRDLPPPALAAIRAALAARGLSLETVPAETRLFAISSHGFYANLKRYATKAGLGPVTPHVLRHSAAKLRRETGASIEEIGALLGHQSLYTTARYLARLEGERDEGWQGVAALLGV